jgi:hypothetical protein
MNLPRLPQIQEGFVKSCKNWAKLVKNKDRQGFVNKMEAIRKSIEEGNPDFGKAYDNMYRIAEGL